jgi:hypothetical protein
MIRDHADERAGPCAPDSEYQVTLRKPLRNGPVPGSRSDGSFGTTLDRGGSGRVVELGTPAVLLARDGASSALAA